MERVLFSILQLILASIAIASPRVVFFRNKFSDFFEKSSHPPTRFNYSDRTEPSTALEPPHGHSIMSPPVSEVAIIPLIKGADSRIQDSEAAKTLDRSVQLTVIRRGFQRMVWGLCENDPGLMVMIVGELSS